jgi:acetolactate synthase-1/3 small subunit
MQKDKIIIAIYVDNRYGVLSRVTAMFTRRGFNIDSLTVGETESPEYCRITITLSAAKNDKDQVVSQLRKLYNVKKVIVLSQTDSIKRELLLIKVRNTEKSHADIVEATNIFRTKIIDFTDEAISIEATGDSQKIDAFIEYMKKFEIIEMCRTGLVALDRGGTNIWSEHEDE